MLNFISMHLHLFIFGGFNIHLIPSMSKKDADAHFSKYNYFYVRYLVRTSDLTDFQNAVACKGYTSVLLKMVQVIFAVLGVSF